MVDKAFSVARSCAWNTLPNEIKQPSSRASFCKKLKTLFTAIDLDFSLFFINVIMYGTTEPCRGTLSSFLDDDDDDDDLLISIMI